MALLSIFSAIVIFLFADIGATEPAIQLSKSGSHTMLMSAPAPAELRGLSGNFSLKDVIMNERSTSDLIIGINYIVDGTRTIIGNRSKETINLFKAKLGEVDLPKAIKESRNVTSIITEVYLKSLQERPELTAGLTSINDMFETAEITVLFGNILVELQINEPKTDPNIEKALTGGCCGFFRSRPNVVGKLKISSSTSSLIKSSKK